MTTETFAEVVFASPRRYSWRTFADAALKATAAFWFLVAIIGQLLFGFTVASFYALTPTIERPFSSIPRTTMPSRPC
jgi:hypothetical protein